MKKLLSLLLISSLLLSCTSERGPQGPPGPQGPYIIGHIFEIENVDFTAGNGYSFIGNFSNYVPQLDIYNSDVVLVYLWEGTTNGMDIWSLMPQTFYFNDGGILEYNFNHTPADFEIYLNGNLNFGALSPTYTQDQIFRVAILPAEFAEENNIDVSNIYEVMGALEINGNEIPSLEAIAQ